MLIVANLATTGCYYSHLAAGQIRLLWAREPISEILESPETSAELRGQLEIVARAREIASGIGLEVGGQYTAYVPWAGDRIVTSIVATRPGEIEAAGFRFPIVGTLPYKGFFAIERAEAEASRLRAEGLDVCVVPVSAYSTLGWLDDPVTAPMLRSTRSRAELVELVVHELVHATVYAASEAEFNEGVASFIGEEAALRFAAEEGAASLARERSRIDGDRILARAMLGFRERVSALYATPELAQPELRRRRAGLESAARAELAALELPGRDMPGISQRARLGDACLALRGTYAADTPRHEALLAALGGDLPAFVARLRDAASQSPDGKPSQRFFASADANWP